MAQGLLIQLMAELCGPDTGLRGNHSRFGTTKSSGNPTTAKHAVNSAQLLGLVSRLEKAEADEVASKAGYEGFCIQGQLLHSLESAVSRAAAVHSDKEQ